MTVRTFGFAVLRSADTSGGKGQVAAKGYGPDCLAEEARIFVFSHNTQKLFHRRDFRNRLIAVPLQISAFPIDLPPILSSHESGLAEGAFMLYLGLVPLWANLE